MSCSSIFPFPLPAPIPVRVLTLLMMGFKEEGCFRNRRHFYSSLPLFAVPTRSVLLRSLDRKSLERCSCEFGKWMEGRDIKMSDPSNDLFVFCCLHKLLLCSALCCPVVFCLPQTFSYGSANPESSITALPSSLLPWNPLNLSILSNLLSTSSLSISSHSPRSRPLSFHSISQIFKSSFRISRILRTKAGSLCKAIVPSFTFVCEYTDKS